MSVPLEVLVEKIRRIGAGDLSGPVELTEAGELRALASALNAMCDQLAAARNLADENAHARLSAIAEHERAQRTRAIDRLASGIAHELGTPMNVAIVRAELIMELTADEDVIASARVIKGQVDAMAGAIRRMLEFARPRAPKKERVDLVGLIARTCESIRFDIKAQSIQLWFASPEQSLTVEADPAQIEQVLRNLITNAVDALPNGGEIGVTLERGRYPRQHPFPLESVPPVDWARIQVRDDGIGISKETLSRIFDPFFTTKRGGERMGLGLSVADCLVNGHAGWVEAESNLGQGSCFSVFLPMLSAS